ncbi:MAG: PhoP regulatory network YrbL family protein, partial [Clostridiales bacterium]|nr:PhoP regulatory network YrbL family protein [Clostridiales bacterium]
MKQKETVYLTEELLIGKGGRKDVYINPKNPAQCIKINARDAGDHRVEMNYRRSREIRNLPPSGLMVSYFGSVETNLGTGYVFERIVDYDGTH